MASQTARKSCMKRKSCYDAFEEASPSRAPVAGPSKKPVQMNLWGWRDKGKQRESSTSRDDGSGHKNGDKHAESGDGVQTAEREAFVILMHVFNPGSISEVTVGRACYSLDKANAALDDLFRRVKPEYVDVVVDIGVATEFEEESDFSPDVKRRITPSGRAAYCWHTEEGRGELSVHRITIEE